MFRLRELVGFSSVLAFCVLGWIIAQQYQWGTGQESNSAIYRHSSKRHTVAQLSDQWSAFQIPADSAAIRVLANAAIEADSVKASLTEMPNGEQNTARPEFCYAIEFELLDETSKVIRRGTYHFCSTISQKVDKKTGEHYFPISLAGSESIVTNTRSLHLLLDADLKSARQFRLKKADCDDTVTEVLARTICRSKRRGHSDFGAWRQVSEPRKQELARHSVYDHRMLDQESRNSLLKWKWTRAVPLGRHQQQRLYSIGSDDDAEVITKHVSRAVVVGQGRKIVLPLGEQPITLRVGATATGDANEHVGRINVTWCDPQTGQRRNVSKELKTSAGDSDNTVEIENVEGLVEIETEFPAALRFWTLSPDSSESNRWTEVEFEPTRIHTYLADRQHVAFPISHVDDDTTPLKVILRAILDPQPQDSSRQTTLEPIVESTIAWRMICLLYTSPSPRD